MIKFKIRPKYKEYTIQEARRELVGKKLRCIVTYSHETVNNLYLIKYINKVGEIALEGITTSNGSTNVNYLNKYLKGVPNCKWYII